MAANTTNMTTDDKPVELDPRSYQIEIMEQAKLKNLIVCLPTGSGKTYIAIMLIKELTSKESRRSVKEGGKRTIILVKTVELARQHCATIEKQFSSKVACYAGPSTHNLQDRTKWENDFEENQILIFTAKKFVDILEHNIYSLSQVNLLIFDECHHANGNDPYASIMRQYDSCSSCPRILGLTASISGQKIQPKNLPRAAAELERIYHAQIETGSDRDEIIRNSTSVKDEYCRCDNYRTKVVDKQPNVKSLFKEIESLYDELDKYFHTRRNPPKSQNDSFKDANLSNSILFQCRTLEQLKSHLDNIRHIGYDLGLKGLFLAIQALANLLGSKFMCIPIIDEAGKVIYKKIYEKLDTLIRTDIESFPNYNKVCYSEKVLETYNYIKNNKDGQCIVFVERIYTAIFLSQILKELYKDEPDKIKHLTGSQSSIDKDKSLTKYQCQVITDFRKKAITVLVSTAVIEEGLDVPECNLIIRFNKPPNFSSYLQSKGRARAQTGNALFIIMRDEGDYETFAKNSEEFENYTHMEKMLKQNFQSEPTIDRWSSDDQLPSYKTDKVKICAMRAVEIIYLYCATLASDSPLSPHFCCTATENKKFRCTLSMPKSCSITEPVTCEQKTKKVAKQECCLKMVETLHKNGKLDDYCMPILRKRSAAVKLGADGSNPPKPVIIDKQTSHLFHTYNGVSNPWYLYRINISNNNTLGFVVPCKLKHLSSFVLYGRDSEYIVDSFDLKTVDIHLCRSHLEMFCQYIFEEVFNKMNIQSESVFKFDIESSNFKLLPCLLTESDDIDYDRMASICQRKDKPVLNPSELNEQELYYISYISERQYFQYISDRSLLKQPTDPRKFKKSEEKEESYAEYFEKKVFGLKINRNFPLAAMMDFRKPRINYLNKFDEKRIKESLNGPSHFAIEVLRYAPLNREDYDLIYKLPSVLVRLSQLQHIEQLRCLLTFSSSRIQTISYDALPIEFTDYLEKVFPPKRPTALPLTCLRYDSLLRENCTKQPSPELLFQAVTRRSADEKTDMENLEILGDCFLKLAVSLSRFHRDPSGDAGDLTVKKDWLVSNQNLYELAMKKGLQHYLNADKPVYSGKQANWVPPGYKVNEDDAERYLQAKVKRKAVADMIEAMIGCYLVSTNYVTTMKFMQWLGLDVLPSSDSDQMNEIPPILRVKPTDTICDIKEEIDRFFSEKELDEIEKEINYTFKNRAYLIAAFTHASYVHNRLTQCYDRLEYLGDAVLDFLVIRCVFVEHYAEVTPSRVTNLRQDLSNNGRLASIVHSHNLHKKISYLSSHLFNAINVFDSVVKERAENHSTEEEDDNQWADSTAPKPLADVFEAMVGAIFLDCGYSLEIVWRVIEPLLRHFIDQSIKHTNLNPVREFFEKRGKRLREEHDDEGNFVFVGQIPDGTETNVLFANLRVSTAPWYLYRIYIRSKTKDNSELGFIVPLKLIELPKFIDDQSMIKVIFQKEIRYLENRHLFERFCRHIFENVFDFTMFEFNINASTFKLLPCLLTGANEVDFDRMSTICERYKKSLKYPSDLCDTELYSVSCSPIKLHYMYKKDPCSKKRATDHRSGTETYADYYEKLLPNVRIQRDSLLCSMKVINKMKLSLNVRQYEILSSDQTIYYYPIEVLSYAPLNKQDFELILMLPSILNRIVQLYHLQRLRTFMFEFSIFLVSCNQLDYEITSLDDRCIHEQPSIELLFQAITRCSADHRINMESLETLGDCFLKLAVSMALYYQYPSANVGVLTKEKIQEITNENLYRIAVESRLKTYLYSDKIILDGNDFNWLPPGYIIKVKDQMKYTHQTVKRKAFADMIEALIGAFLISSNYITTIRFMQWLGLNVIPLDENSCIMSTPPIIAPASMNEINRIFHEENFSEIENKLRYKFRNKAYLVAAFTHPSKSIQSNGISYERLEFLGDALLDFLVIRYTFLNYDQHVTPGRLTDIRQDLSNNSRLGYLLVSYELHTNIRYRSSELSQQIQVYIDHFKLTSKTPLANAPKIFADVFEALIGAIFFDSNNSLETVWKVIEPFLGSLFDQSIIDPNISPIRTIVEKGGKIVREFTDENGAICLVQMGDGRMYEGRGQNKKLAKSDACRQALNEKN
ncbi:unnamed protein product [Adineta ricciae]|uniref:Uncharacterized protein n=1 Tax=Adineta ricciae TaxID=249248 RepID=A0A814KQQ9_ADIRI|nr:unnamed protein product [Adineta ricciae]